MTTLIQQLRDNAAVCLTSPQLPPAAAIAGCLNMAADALEVASKFVEAFARSPDNSFLERRRAREWLGKVWLP